LFLLLSMSLKNTNFPHKQKNLESQGLLWKIVIAGAL
jgi:hypothetical protein